MTTESLEKAIAEATGRAIEALEPSDGEQGPVGCAVALFCGRQAILGSSGTIDVAALGGQEGGRVRLTLEDGETLELAPRFRTPGEPAPDKRMATTEELSNVRATRGRHSPLPPGSPDGLDDAARIRVAQKVLETAEELERLIKGAASGPSGKAPRVAVSGALRRSALLGQLPPALVDELGHFVDEFSHAAGEAVPDAPAVHVIVAGKIEARRAGHPTRILGPGDDFGLEAAVRPGERRYELWALTDVSGYALKREGLLALADLDPRLALAVSQAVARRLAVQLDEAYDWAAVK